ncbi:hypothetical protein V2J09_008535 [Rumex salicifolius]
METSRDSHTQIDVYSSPRRSSPLQSPSRSSSSSSLATSFAVDGHQEEAVIDRAPPAAVEEKLRFLGSLAKNRENTWVVSLFFLLHLAAFAATMFVNDCWRFSHGDCTFRILGRLSFQHIYENPLLGPSFSTLDTMGALRQHQKWRIFACLCLHAGAFHLIINLLSVLFLGIHLEQKFGAWRIGIIYVLSALTGSLMAALFVQNIPAVCSSGALFGLIGCSLSGLIRDWNLYTDKYAALIAIFVVFVVNFLLGLLPYVDNFANIGGLISGFLLGFVLLISPHLREKAQHKGMFDYGTKNHVALRQSLDRPLLRIISFIFFCLIFASLGLAYFRHINIGKVCTWCQYLDCIPSKNWTCEIKPSTCKSTVSGGRLTVTCMSNEHFRILPFTDITPRRLQELCILICSQ